MVATFVGGFSRYVNEGDSSTTQDGACRQLATLAKSGYARRTGLRWHGAVVDVSNDTGSGSSSNHNRYKKVYSPGERSCVTVNVDGHIHRATVLAEIVIDTYGDLSTAGVAQAAAFCERQV